MTDDELRVGDIIDVLEPHLGAPDHWVPAEVVSVEEHRIGALLMGGATVGQFIALERSTENRMWKRE